VVTLRQIATPSIDLRPTALRLIAQPFPLGAHRRKGCGSASI
jgi:hypothetical protein